MKAAKDATTKPKGYYALSMMNLLDEPTWVLNTARYAVFAGIIAYGYSLYSGWVWLNVVGVILMMVSTLVYYEWRTMSDKNKDTYKMLTSTLDKAADDSLLKNKKKKNKKK